MTQEPDKDRPRKERGNTSSANRARLVAQGPLRLEFRITEGSTARKRLGRELRVKTGAEFRQILATDIAMADCLGMTVQPLPEPGPILRGAQRGSLDLGSPEQVHKRLWLGNESIHGARPAFADHIIRILPLGEGGKGEGP